MTLCIRSLGNVDTSINRTLVYMLPINTPNLPTVYTHIQIIYVNTEIVLDNFLACIQLQG